LPLAGRHPAGLFSVDKACHSCIPLFISLHNPFTRGIPVLTRRALHGKGNSKETVSRCRRRPAGVPACGLFSVYEALTPCEDPGSPVLVAACGPRGGRGAARRGEARETAGSGTSWAPSPFPPLAEGPPTPLGVESSVQAEPCSPAPFPPGPIEWLDPRPAKPTPAAHPSAQPTPLTSAARVVPVARKAGKAPGAVDLQTEVCARTGV
jgi:hypothetical protein